jgi:hypothetical protein
MLVRWAVCHGWNVLFANDHAEFADVAEVYVSAKHRLPTLVIWRSAMTHEAVCDGLLAGELARGELGWVLEQGERAILAGAVVSLEPRD